MKFQETDQRAFGLCLCVFILTIGIYCANGCHCNIMDDNQGDVGPVVINVAEPIEATVGLEQRTPIELDRDLGEGEILRLGSESPDWCRLDQQTSRWILISNPVLGSSLPPSHEVTIEVVVDGEIAARKAAKILVEPWVGVDHTKDFAKKGRAGQQCVRASVQGVPSVELDSEHYRFVRIGTNTGSLTRGSKFRWYDTDSKQTILGETSVASSGTSLGMEWESGESIPASNLATAKRMIDGRFEVCVTPESDDDLWYLRGLALKLE